MISIGIVGDTQGIIHPTNGNRQANCNAMVDYYNDNCDAIIQVGDFGRGQTLIEDYRIIAEPWRNLKMPYSVATGNWDLGFGTGVAASSLDNPNFQLCLHDNGCAALLITTRVDGDTITIGSVGDYRTYTYRTVLSTGPTIVDEILIGGDLVATVVNTVLALNKGTGEGTNYSVDTTVNIHVFAVDFDSDEDGVGLLFVYGHSRVVGTDIDLSDTLTVGGFIDPFEPSTATPVTTLSAARLTTAGYGGMRDKGWFGGMNGSLNSHYILFTVHEVDFVVISIPFGPLQADMIWAKSIADLYPERWVILNCHSFLFSLDPLDNKALVTRGEIHSPDNATYWAKVGNGSSDVTARRTTLRVGYEMWNDEESWALKSWDNLKIITCGHEFVNSTLVQGYLKLNSGAGKPNVHVFHVNYQPAYNGGITRFLVFTDDGHMNVVSYDAANSDIWPRTQYEENFAIEDTEIWRLPSQI